MTDTGPRTYEFLVAGHLDDHWAGWLGDFTIIRNPDASSTLVGSVSDQTHLHGVLARLRDTGATLLSVRATDHGTRGQHRS